MAFCHEAGIGLICVLSDKIILFVKQYLQTSFPFSRFLTQWGYYMNAHINTIFHLDKGLTNDSFSHIGNIDTIY